MALLDNSDDRLIPVIRFSTDGMRQSDAHEAWLQRDWPSANILFDTTPLVPFRTTSEAFQLGSLLIMHAKMGSQRWARDEKRIRRDDIDHVTFSVRVSGGARGEANGRSFHAATGSIVAVDLARPNSHDSDSSRTIQIAVPRAITEARLGRVEHLNGAIASSFGAGLVRSHILQLCSRIGAIPGNQQDRLADTVLDLLAVAYADSGVIAPRERGDAALQYKARQQIESRLGSPSLTVAALCKQMGFSRSTLYRLFHDEGGVQTFIRQRRLEAVRSELSDPAIRAPITEIAERWGFCDAAYLGRLFRESYGMTPGEARNQALEASRS
ncbi:helix-turn-helix domain-containing protein [Sphingomonas sp. CGMCC 1.13654]|uniref:Helix-turn-helix domain-containing protein n=1 Tax=Sphingomonas chungangi TaxID=2683589 RepID=A0A838LBM8_9SPHN|nr:helix-turn-helix domain-containing protein [Sphingomonas chungangi]MBA2936614.1 helix-turn-helix domain-containing protein [Sphingomonas chungangi]MVW55999.1 helix-turn-helix domain-containing protein [Sphingomonas chungangi]